MFNTFSEATAEVGGGVAEDGRIRGAAHIGVIEATGRSL